MADFRKMLESYRFTAMKYDFGYINEASFLKSCESYAMKDNDERLWRIEPVSGTWQFYGDNEWVVAVPPGFASSDAVRHYNALARKGMNPWKYYAVYIVVVAMIGFYGDPKLLESPMQVIIFLAVLYLLCVGYVCFTRRGSWTGVVVELYNDIGEQQDRVSACAKILLDDGQTISTSAMPGWEVGARVGKINGIEEILHYRKELWYLITR